MTTSKKSLRQIDQRDLSRVRGGMLLIPAVQKFRDTVAPLAAGTLFLKFEGIDGDATE